LNQHVLTPLPDQGVGSRPQIELVAEKRGGRTVLTSQYVTYPFHLTRPFQLDAARADVSTLYMQSSSGGLYAGEDLRLRIAARAGANLHLTTQASTIVQGGERPRASARYDLTVEDGAFLAFTPDPQILFPGSFADTEIALSLTDGACAVVSDGFLLHDPRRLGRAPEAYRTVTDVSIGGRRVMVDRQFVEGRQLIEPSGPLHGHAIAGTVLLLGFGNRLAAAELAEAVADCGARLAISALPRGCGFGLRILAKDGPAYARALDAAFGAAFVARFGIAPAPRRK